MNRNRQLSASLIFLTFTAAAYATEISLNNRLSSCIVVEQKGITTQKNLVILNTQIFLKKPISECGCFSAAGRYTSYLKQGSEKDILQEGQISTMQAGPKQLVISSETAFVNNRQVFVELSCTPPL